MVANSCADERADEHAGHTLTARLRLARRRARPWLWEAGNVRIRSLHVAALNLRARLIDGLDSAG